MSEIYIAREKRKGLLLPFAGTKANPNVLFPLEGVEKSELDELIRAILAKMGVTDEVEIQAIIAKAEADREVRMKIFEARQKLRKYMEMRRQGQRLIQNGFRNWVPAFFRPIRTKGE